MVFAYTHQKSTSKLINAQYYSIVPLILSNEKHLFFCKLISKFRRLTFDIYNLHKLICKILTRVLNGLFCSITLALEAKIPNNT